MGGRKLHQGRKVHLVASGSGGSGTALTSTSSAALAATFPAAVSDLER